MSFGHPSQHGHMMAGLRKAIDSPNTPAHLKPHLEARMKTFKGKPITGSKTQMKPSAPAMTPGTSAQAQKQIAAPPMPFKSSAGPAMAPTGKGPTPNVGNGKSKNTAGLAKGSAPSIAATGNSVPGGYNKVVGGRKGTSHPAKKGNSAFFGR